MQTGDESHHGAALAAITAGLADPPTSDRPRADGDRAAVVLRLQAQHTARAADTETPTTALRHASATGSATQRGHIRCSASTTARTRQTLTGADHAVVRRPGGRTYRDRR